MPIYINWGTVLAAVGVLTPIVFILIRGAIKYVHLQDERVSAALTSLVHDSNARLSSALEGQAHATDMLTAELKAQREERRRIEDLKDKKLDAVVYELQHTNDGSTVKGTLVGLRDTAAAAGHRLTNLEKATSENTDRITRAEQEVRELRETVHQAHPRQTRFAHEDTFTD